MKRILALMLSLTLIISGTVMADDTETYKEESIYGLLSYNGGLETAYVVNAVNGLATDYGHYDLVENLTNREGLTINDDLVILPSSQGTFYYQGELADLGMPWEFDIKYYLDGEEVSSDTLAGSSGHLKIEISTNQGDEDMAYFYDHFTLQISLALLGKLTNNLEATGATLVEAGGTKQIAFTVLPGNDGDFIVEADVHDFEMDAISINAVKMVFNMEIDSSELTDRMSELGDAVTELDGGAQEILGGMEALSYGLGAYTEGMGEFSAGLSSFASGGAELAGGLEMMADGLTSLSTQGTALEDGIKALSDGAFTQVNQQLAMMGMEIPEINRENYQMILGGQPELEPILVELEATVAFTDGLLAYMAGVDEISANASGLSIGLNEYVQGALGLSEGANDLYAGVSEIDEGMVDLTEGMAEFQSGTNAFKEGTATMEAEMTSQVDEMISSFMGDDAPLVSFASADNEHIQSVQFFFRTSPINIEESESVDDSPEEEENLWDRIVNLFDLLLVKIGLKK